MARILFPEDFTSQKTLLEAIKAKDAADGANSFLKPYLTQNNLSLTNLLTIAGQAKTQDDSRLVLFKQSTNYTQLRDLTFAPIVEHLKGEVQFLKGLFKPNINQLGDWDITVVNNSKITYPAGFDELATVAGKFFDKHLSYAAGTSPLQAYITKNKIDVTIDKANIATAQTYASKAITTAQTYASKAITTAKNSENATQQRDILWNPVIENLKGMGDYLMRLYGENSKGLGDWGFVIDLNPAKPKLQTTKIKLGDKATLKGVVIGGTLTNIGTIDVHLYKGSSTSGNPIIIHAGEKYGINKGYNTITISNPSELETAVISTLRSS
jgi:hypothetical protein